MRLALTNLQNSESRRELFYDRGFGAPFDWNSPSDLSMLNEWRQEKIRKHARRNWVEMRRTKVVENQANNVPGSEAGRSSRKMKSEDATH